MSTKKRLGVTTIRQVVVAVVAGALCAVVLLSVVQAFAVFPPVVPWSVAVVLLIAAVATVVYSRVFVQRLEERKVSPQEAVIALSIAKSMAMTGAAFAGAHAVYVVRFVTRIDAALPAARVIQGSAALVCSLLLAGAGTILERACLVKGPDDDEKTAASPETV